MLKALSSTRGEEKNRVSVIVTAYNQESLLRKALQSVWDQAYRPIQCLVIDDGSTDGTPGVSADLARRQTEVFTVQVHRQQNQGAQAARNAGLALSQGEYIQYLDGDDVLAAQKIGDQVRFLSAHKQFDAVYGDACFLLPQGNAFTPGEQIGMGPVQDFLSSLLIGGWNPNFSYLCRRSAVEACGPWEPSIKINQDYEYFLRMACRGFRFGYVAGPTGYYRKHSQQRISERPIVERARVTLSILQSAEKTAVAARTLTPERQIAFARAYRRVSYWCFGQDRSAWRTSLAAALRLCPKLPPEGRLARWLHGLCGAWAAESVLGVARELKRRLRSHALLNKTQTG